MTEPDAPTGTRSAGPSTALGTGLGCSLEAVLAAVALVVLAALGVLLLTREPSAVETAKAQLQIERAAAWQPWNVVLGIAWRVVAIGVGQVLLTINALAAADLVLVPLQLEYLAVRKSINPNLGILPTFYRKATKHHQQVLADLQQLTVLTRILAPIPNSIIVADAHERQSAVSQIRRDHVVAAAYRELAREVDREWQ
jgi:hypothetical protein